MTDWYVLVPATYPWGGIDFYPAKQGGLELTFHHQSFNSFGDENVPWRTGKICQQTSLRHSGRRIYDHEPMSRDERLAWHFSRAQEWLLSASNDALVQSGDPFELPDFPTRTIVQTAFVENSDSFQIWSTTPERIGYAAVMRHESNEGILFLTSFMDVRRKRILDNRFGVALEKSFRKTGDALWIRLDTPPVLDPWHPPDRLGELLKILAPKGVELKAIIQQLAHPIRDGKRHLLLLGFPIPRNIGDPPDHFHWQPFLLPVLSNGKVKGFQPKENSYQRRDNAVVLQDNMLIEWVRSRNWDSTELTSRGALPPEVARNKIALIGVGALGAPMAHLLVRMRIDDLIVIDGDLLDVGNLCRHPEVVKNVARPKAESVATSLNAAVPHANVSFINKNLSACDEKDLQLIQDRDVIIDCTGNDTLLSELAQWEWASEKLFISVSVGRFARRLFYFVYQGKRFPHESFAQKVSPWLAQEANDYKDLPWPREGIGCWNPVFPARSDDIWLMASMATKLFEYDAMHRPVDSVFRVYEQSFVDGLPTGLRKMDDGASDAQR
ncbi:MAG: ThiF family adenylyltransferase [Deltaproteobacteria bacterium]|nr:ThiF family adenylyltransferase [Deltaproteobacteria bacterium]